MKNRMLKRIKFLVLINLINWMPFTRFYKIKALILELAGVKCGFNVRVGGKISVSSPNLTIGDNVWIGNNITFYNSGSSSISIGNNVDLAPNCVLCTGTHEIGDSKQRAGKGLCKDIKIEDGCWIGINATILPGVIVGKGSVVAAGSVVNKAVNPNSMVGGTPAKFIKPLKVST